MVTWHLSASAIKFQVVPSVQMDLYHAKAHLESLLQKEIQGQKVKSHLYLKSNPTHMNFLEEEGNYYYVHPEFKPHILRQVC